ncbi:Phosphatase regulon transcriptional regulatory protein [gamma proteobacterium HdN1]|nr:Phosphatase regulon transcriptional regulatory protein [gamma proteobacterium HdN1]
MKANILIVDDEIAICELLTLALEQAGFTVQAAYDGKEAWIKLAEQAPDLLLLDWMLPGTSGIELARRIRQTDNLRTLPIIMLSAKSEEDNKITGLEIGADDYITKPFSTRELISRIKALLRRRAPDRLEQQLVHGELTLDVISQRVHTKSGEISLGPIEFKLLEFFLRNPNRVFSREQLLNRVWGSTVYIEDRTVDVHILRLRKSLNKAELPPMIETVRGSGYRLSPA